jgi:hypothetical protein
MEPEDNALPPETGPSCPGCDSTRTMQSLETPDERLFSCVDCGTAWYQNTVGDKRILIPPKKR